MSEQDTLRAERITELWSRAIVLAAQEQRSEPHVFAELVWAEATAAERKRWTERGLFKRCSACAGKGFVLDADGDEDNCAACGTTGFAEAIKEDA